MSMFCFQCQETSKGTGCTIKGVCGKTEDVAKLQDLLIYTLKGISQIVVKAGLKTEFIPEVNYQLVNSLFMTITNANFDANAIEAQIHRMLALRDELQQAAQLIGLHDAATFRVSDSEPDTLCYMMYDARAHF